jgi:hypothetical protein
LLRSAGHVETPCHVMFTLLVPSSGSLLASLFVAWTNVPQCVGATVHDEPWPLFYSSLILYTKDVQVQTGWDLPFSVRTASDLPPPRFTIYRENGKFCSSLEH